MEIPIAGKNIGEFLVRCFLEPLEIVKKDRRCRIFDAIKTEKKERWENLLFNKKKKRSSNTVYCKKKVLRLYTVQEKKFNLLLNFGIKSRFRNAIGNTLECEDPKRKKFSLDEIIEINWDKEMFIPIIDIYFDNIFMVEKKTQEVTDTNPAHADEHHRVTTFEMMAKFCCIISTKCERVGCFDDWIFYATHIGTYYQYTFSLYLFLTSLPCQLFVSTSSFPRQADATGLL